MTEEEELAAEFETHRSYLHAIAFRMLGSHADADDAVQEAWLRLARTGREGIEDLRGWLTTVTGRVCLDALRKRGVRGEQPLVLDVGALPREAMGDARTDPEEEALLADSVGLALYVVMDALTPAERVSFVLHDIFEIPFSTIAAILGRSTAATKMLASRARGRLRSGTSAADAHAAARNVVDAFLAAAGRGDVAALLSVLAPDVELRAQSPDGTFVVRGAGEVAAQARRFARPDAKAYPALVDGVPGVLITVGGRPVTVMAFTVADGAVTVIRGLTDPVRLGKAVPSWVV
ncbi:MULTISPECIES: sigma-70 family RNA polymerase sigma factor [Actinomadura]|uniref:Sigma-70 family RNA polymerase sigma factor n=1 Tax=Actinomadura yumaensis TaxID=111807 RepID=A0ABW2CKB5_9ACTN|nr:sigma-70 family RNA polymerase sigma factor [Actinomadura sp. J1-007]MWK39993.1 sigma-70 family RNA polymerase sigma factor [Actinomadura sp. J1-007]